MSLSNPTSEDAFDRGVKFGREESADVAETMGYFATARAILAGGDDDKIEHLLIQRQRTVLLPSVAMANAIYLVRRERIRQEQLWPGEVLSDGTGGEQAVALAATVRKAVDAVNNTDANTFANVLVEEVLEALAESDPLQLEQELVQVAAVCVKWLEALDRRRHR